MKRRFHCKRVEQFKGKVKANVIPSEVEESRSVVDWLHHGILRLRFAPLRMTTVLPLQLFNFLTF
jgi:hypothetical protein